MSELVIVASDLYFAAGSQALPAGASLPGLDRMARFGAAQTLPRGWRPWLAAWMGASDLASASPAAIAAAGMPQIESGEADSRLSSASPRFIWLADPLHLAASLTSVHLDPQGLLRVDAPTQSALCRAFNAAFRERDYHLTAARAGRFLASGPAPSGSIETTDPARCLGATLADALPRGAAAGPLRRLGAEIEMWLHEHPINLQRAAAGRPPISTLWLWGGGSRLGARIESSAENSGQRSTALFSDDAYVEGLARLLDASCAPAAAALASVGSSAPRVAVTLELFAHPEELPGARRSGSGAPGPLETLDREWLVPALDRLARGTLSRCVLIANDRCVALGSRDRLKLWRRPRRVLAVLSPSGPGGP